MYKINHELHHSLNEDEKKVIMADLQTYISPDSIVAAILYNIPSFNSDKKIIYEEFFRMKEKYPDFFDEFIFSDREYHHSELLDRILFRLQTTRLISIDNPSYKNYKISEEQQKQIKDNIISKIEDDKLNKINEMATLMKRKLEYRKS